MSKYELFACLGSHDANITVQDCSGRRLGGDTVSGILQVVTREDGSGNNFNLLIRQHDGKLRNVFVRTH